MVKRLSRKGKDRLARSLGMREAMFFDAPSFLGRGKKPGAEREYVQPLTEAQRQVIQENASVITEVSGWVMNRLRREFPKQATRQHELSGMVDDYVHAYVVNAARSWCREKGASFKTYVTTLRLPIFLDIRDKWVKRIAQDTQSFLVQRVSPFQGKRRDEKSTKAQERSRPVVSAVLSGESKKLAEAILARLPRNEALVLGMRYGVGRPALSLEETAQELGLTRSEVRVLEASGLQALGASKHVGKSEVRDRETARSLDKGAMGG